MCIQYTSIFLYIYLYICITLYILPFIYPLSPPIIPLFAGAMMSVDDTLMCSFQILKPAEKRQRLSQAADGKGL